MDGKEVKQERLVHINNLCITFGTTIEKHYSNPDEEELLAVIKQLAEECGAYLRA